MNEQTLVSIIIPTYKNKDSLTNAVDSCLRQTYKNIEIIVVDDNNPNTDERFITESIMQEYVSKDNIIYLKHEINKNGAAARNTGFRHSRGGFICFLDDDDVFYEKKVEKQVDYLIRNPEFHSAYSWRLQNGKTIKSDKTGDLSKELLSLEFTPYTSSIMIRKEAVERINGFDERYKRHQDYEFLLRYFEHYSIGVVREPLVHIVGNEVNNTLQGKELEELKVKFLSQFAKHIERIDNQEKGFRNLVYGRHFAQVFWNYIKLLSMPSAIRLFFSRLYLHGFIFLLSIFRYLIKHINAKRKNDDV